MNTRLTLGENQKVYYCITSFFKLGFKKKIQVKPIGGAHIKKKKIKLLCDTQDT